MQHYEVLQQEIFDHLSRYIFKRPFQRFQISNRRRNCEITRTFHSQRSSRTATKQEAGPSRSSPSIIDFKRSTLPILSTSLSSTMDVDAHLIRTNIYIDGNISRRREDDDDDIACSSYRRNPERGRKREGTKRKREIKGTREQRRSENTKPNSRFAPV